MHYIYILASLGLGNSRGNFSPSAYAEVAAALEGCSTRSCLEYALPRCVGIDGLTWGAVEHPRPTLPHESAMKTVARFA